ncbi:glycosyl transferase [Methanobacterium formicicum DSM 3637]|uniref:Glycosyl transferase n=2 Tax=Methanobacterium formicicum TaxID=2162 RepID=K2RAU0_METFP|nr:glycosyl transferase [Methanobacterium formicicum DSM 3637]
MNIKNFLMIKLSKFSVDKKLDILIPLFLAILILVTRIPFMSKFLYEWDSVNYALGFNEYNITQEQPHSPGYIFYTALGKGVNYVFNDPNMTMICLAIFFTIFTTILIYFMVKELFGRKLSIVTGILFVFNPLIWFYGNIASIYIFEAFFSVLIAYTSYKFFKGDEKFLYISAIALGLAGGFRIDIVEFLIPLWIFCIWYKRPSYKKILTGLILFGSSLLLWIIPTAISAGGIEQYLTILKSTSEAASCTSLLFGATIKEQLLNSGACVMWLLLGLSIMGTLAVLSFLVYPRKELISKFIFYLKKPVTFFFLLWVGPALIFYLVIYVVKPGYILTCIPPIMIILAWIINRVANIINVEFPRISAKKALTLILTIYVLLNAIYFIYPFEINNGEIWETSLNDMSTSQKVMFGLDVGFIYNTAKINANDENTQLHVENILNISNYDPSSTIIVVRDITREDEGFNWRKAMYYLPSYDIYYLFDGENSENTKSVVSWHGKGQHFTKSEGDTLNITINDSTRRIVWIMSNETSFYQEVNAKFGVHTINLPNGLNIYYSDVGVQSNTTISDFTFKTG